MTSSRFADGAETFETYRKDVYGWALQMLGSHHDALDMVQEVFVRWLVQARRGLPEHPRSWLRRATLNRVIDAIRSRKKRGQPADPEALIAEASVQEESADLDRKLLRADVAEAFGKLTEAQRNVLTAKTYEGLTFKEIADELGTSASTAKTHYLRALRAMRDHLAPQWSAEME
ncbi:MAG: RNA polymerase sigma factor [Planctomycetota bacterium]|jgi:RNA polymerase sigma-70 factor (ECF subfamily)